jgi:hypothetical protein
MREPGATYGHRLVINQDVENKILIRIRVYGQDHQLVENYGYEDLDLDARFADADFDPSNSAYRFWTDYRVHCPNGMLR